MDYVLLYTLNHYFCLKPHTFENMLIQINYVVSYDGGVEYTYTFTEGHSCFMNVIFDVAIGFCPSQQVFQSCRDETLMLHRSMEDIKVSCVWAQHGEGRYRTHYFSILTPEL